MKLIFLNVKSSRSCIFKCIAGTTLASVPILFFFAVLCRAVYPCMTIADMAGEGRSGFTTETVSPHWERDADADATGRYVLASVMDMSDVATLNMLCSMESMEEVRALRSMLAAEIESPMNNDVMKHVATLYLKRACASDMSPLSCCESKLLRYSMNVKGCAYAGSGARPGTTSSGSESMCMAAIAASVSQTMKRSPWNALCSMGFAPRFLPAPGVMPAVCYTKHVDYYRLFLYIKDSTGAAAHVIVSVHAQPVNSPITETTLFKNQIPFTSHGVRI